jgi:N-acyl-D-amino-acid deacylase
MLRAMRHARKWLAGIAMLALLPGMAPPERIVIRGGTIYDGSSGTPLTGDVVIEGDRIVHVGSPRAEDAGARVIDASGMIVAPGFIDPHTHSDDQIASADPAERLVKPWLAQGVTTVFTGNDGYGQKKEDPAALFARIAASKVGPNVVTYVGFGAVRQAVIGDAARAPSDAELARMQALVAQRMCQGAIGLSTGLYYAPQSFAKTEEVIALAREAAKRGGVYDTHQRDESSYSIGLMASIAETIRIGREAGMPVHFAHIKASGPTVHGKAGEMIAAIEGARAAGVDVTADQYPYEASGTSLAASMVPRWAQDGGMEALLTRLAEPETRARIAAEMKDNLARRGGAANQLLTQPGQAWAGKRLSEVAAEWGLDPVDAAIRIITTTRDGSATLSFNMIEPDIALLMRQPWVMTGSDGSAAHPRMYGTFALKYAKYVVEQKTISLAEFVNSSSGRTADFFRLEGRGHLKPGYFADVVVFDPKAYRARSTYLEPRLLAEGVRTLLVNGQVAIDKGAFTGVAAGRGLKHVPPKGSCP